MVRIKRLYYNNKKFYIIISKKRREYFIKLNSNISESNNEKTGYEILSKYYILPNRNFYSNFHLFTVTSYDYWGKCEKDNGLLVDLLNKGTDDDISSFMDQYKNSLLNSFNNTYKLSNSNDVINKLYKDRAAKNGRIDIYYNHNSIKPINPNLHHIKVNKIEYLFKFKSIISETQFFFDNLLEQPSFITQGDPTDVNIGIPFTYFDYDTAGRNNIFGEFANFLTYVAFYGGYIVPKYFPRVYKYHTQSFEKIVFNAPTIEILRSSENFSEILLKENIIEQRKLLLKAYINEVVYFICNELNIQDIEKAMRPFIIMRLVAVFNIFQLEYKDTLFLLTKMAECSSEKFNLRNFFIKEL